MDDWQQQCCGETFDVGSKVTWSCVPTDGLSLTDVLGPELARTVTDREEHHGGEGTRPLTGIVRSIHAVCHDVAPRPGEHPRHFYPVPGTTVLTEVEIADGWFKAAGEARFAGYLIELA
jgi:hypothetical protein